MIGQENLLKKIQRQIEEDTFPHFCIITGAEGSGKKTLVKEIHKMFGEGTLVSFETGISGVREAINRSYEVSGEKLFIMLADADKMSTEAKNALLKVAEEPPNDAYIIMTFCDLSNALDTLKSRAAIYIMENYSSEEIDQYYKQVAKELTLEEHNIIIDICETPGEVELMREQKTLEFYDYVELCVDNIGEVTDANSFKMAEKLSLKADADGYDLKMFFKVFMSICIKRMHENSLKYAAGTSITSKYLKQLGIRGVNKQMLLDAWILEMREVW